MLKTAKKKSTILLNPVVILASMALGIAAGIFYKDFALKLAPLGDIFLLLLKMCVYPILVTSVVCSFGRLMRSSKKKTALGRIFFFYAIAFVAVSALALYGALAVGPGKNIPPQVQESLGRILLESGEKGIPQFERGSSGIYGFVRSIIPENIFEALGKGENLQILFFSVLLGMAAGLTERRLGDQILELSEAAFQSFLDIINWTMLALPFGLFFLLAGQIASTGISILWAMLNYIGFLYGLSLLVLIVNGILISMKTGKNFFRTFALLKDPLFVSFGTRSTFASIPVCIRSLRRNFRLDPEVVNLVLPMGAVLARFSVIILYSSAAAFTAQLYNLPLGQADWILLLLYSIPVAIAGSGTPMAASLSMLSLIFAPVALPSTAIVVLLIAIIPFVDPMLTMANVHLNCALTVLIDKEGR